MFSDIRAVVWKEWKELPRRHADWRVTTAAGIAVAMYFGWSQPSLFESMPTTLLSAGALGTAMVFYIVPDSFAGERERGTLETLLSSPLSATGLLTGKLLAASLVAWGEALVFLLGFVAAVVGFHGLDVLRPSYLGAAAVLGLPMTSLVAAVGAVVSMRSRTVAKAQQILALGFVFAAVIPTAITVWLIASDLVPNWAIAGFRTIVLYTREAAAGELIALAFLGLTLLNALILIGGLVSFRRDSAI